jgi:cobalt/nickel transport system permease protein
MSGGHGHSVDPGAPLDGPLARLAPEAKVVGAVAFLLVVVATPAAATTAWFVYAALLVGLAVAALLPVRVLARRLVFEVPFLALAAALVLFGADPRLRVAGLSLSEPGITAAATIVARATAGVVVASILAATTTPGELLAALHRLHAPRLLCTITGTALRYLAVLRDELDRLRLAQQLRSPDRRRLRPAEVAAIGAALFVRAYERGERVHLARVARGVGATATAEIAEDTVAPRAGTGAWLAALGPAAVALAALAATTAGAGS